MWSLQVLHIPNHGAGVLGRSGSSVSRSQHQAATEGGQQVSGRRSCPLVVDYDHAFAELVRLALTDAGIEVVIASNGSAATDALRAESFDLILLDIRMPVMDGWTFAGEYQSTPEPRPPI